MVKVGVIREGKVPPDTRVPLSPQQIIKAQKIFGNVEFFIQSSPIRCFKDDEYQKLGIKVVEDVSHCDILLGVKEVQIPDLIAGKTYFFFSHTIKKQEYNRELLRQILAKRIRLIDYETLTDSNRVRIIGFGRFAGLVGAHYALYMWGKRTGSFDIKRAVDCYDLQEMFSQYKALDFKGLRILITGNGRVSKGAVETMKAAGIPALSPKEFLANPQQSPVYVQCDMDHLYKRKDNEPFEFSHFFSHPDAYTCIFKEYASSTNALINGMFWNPSAERLFELDDIQKPGFGLKIISDISCDINGSVPINLKATTISEPFYGYHPTELKECASFIPESIDLMTVDNLPNELPRDASEMFGDMLIEKILPELFGTDDKKIIERAVIAEDGKLTDNYSYLQAYVNGIE